MLVHTLQYGRQEHEEADVLVRRLARLEQVGAVELVVGRDRERPVAMLAGAVDAGKRLLVHDRLQSMSRCDLAEDAHHEMVVIHRDVGVLEDRCELELARRHFVVPRDDRHTEFVEFMLDFADARLHALGDTTEVVVFELLATWGRRADERARSHDEVGAQREVRAVDHEEFLLDAERGVHAQHAGVADEFEQLHGAVRQRVGAAQQRRHFVERFAVVANEDRRNAEVLHATGLTDEHGRRRIPRGVAAGFPRGAQATRREARGVGLGLNELLARERLDGKLVLVEAQEGVMLFGGEAGLRLEPVREVRDATRHRPFLDDLRNDGRDLGIELFAEADGRRELLVDVLGQLGAHLAQPEGVHAEPDAGRLENAVLFRADGDANRALRHFAHGSDARAVHGGHGDVF